MRVLVGCEKSGIVTNAFRMRGHEAFSCDLKPGEKPLWHFQRDIFEVFDRFKPDIFIVHPPCTYLCRGSQYLKDKPERKILEGEALQFVDKLWNLPQSRMAMENPIGILSTKWHRPDQIVFPWQFGDPYSKDIALWVRGMPLLVPEITEQPTKLKKVSNHVNSRMTTEQRRDIKSRFFPGIARAMAETWGNLSSGNPALVTGLSTDPSSNVLGISTGCLLDNSRLSLDRPELVYNSVYKFQFNSDRTI